MPSTFFGVNIAKSGMSTYNAILNTTGHNIANVKTQGYSRQIVNQQATEAISLGTSYGMVGSGTEAVSIDSQRDDYYDKKYRLCNTEYGKYDTLAYYTQSIQDYLYTKDIESGGMTNSIDKFFITLSSLTTDASNTTIRTQAAGYADTLSKYINEAANNLQELQKDVNGQIKSTVDQINAYGEQIASLTKQINTLEVYGTKANDLRDQRATIIDKLSELVDVETKEVAPAEGKGLNQFIVNIGSATFVDTNDTYKILYTARDTYDAMNDIDNLYRLSWNNGQNFDMHGKDLGGKLQALFQLRDGNNNETFRGTATGTQGDTTVTVKDVNDVGSSLLKLDIPATDGILKIGTAEYKYDSFDVTIGADQSYTYQFHLSEPLKEDVTNEKSQIGSDVDFRGIPYYMSQLNEFVRTFSYNFNKVQQSGYDMNGNAGEQMFLAKDKATAIEMKFEQDLTSNFSSIVDTTTLTNGYAHTSYYSMTALNNMINREILSDGKLLACSNSDSTIPEVSNSGNLTNMLALQDDKTMFRQGQPAAFLQVLTSTSGVDGKKIETAAENAKNIKDSVNNRRLSKAGVDEDEEGQNLIVCQNLLNIQYKVLSVMNEVLDKLINGTAI